MASICCAKRSNGNVCGDTGKYQYPNTEYMFCGMHVKQLLFINKCKIDTLDVKIKYDTLKSKFIMGNKTFKELNGILKIYDLGQFHKMENITRGTGRCIITNNIILNHNDEFEFLVTDYNKKHNYDSINRYYVIIEKLGENEYNINGIGEFNYNIFVPATKKMVFRKLTENETKGFWKDVEISKYVVERELYDNSVVINQLKFQCDSETHRANISEHKLNGVKEELIGMKEELISVKEELVNVKEELEVEKNEHAKTTNCFHELLEEFRQGMKEMKEMKKQLEN